jgi:hypothetical protein
MTGTQAGASPPQLSRRRVFSFPNPVNEVAARLVAGGVLVMAVATIAFGLRWMTAVLAYGFLARVLSGPTLSPLGLFVTRIVVPRLERLGVEERPVAGPPKRFAQGMGLAVSLTALLLVLAGSWIPAQAVLACLAAAAFLESVFGLCLGCTVFGVLMRLGVVPVEVCERCNDIWAVHDDATPPRRS